MEYYNDSGMNNKNIKAVIENNILLSESEYGKDMNALIICLIEEYTREINKNTLLKLFNMDPKYEMIKYDSKKNRYYFNVSDEYKIPFEILSENLVKETQKFKDELESSRRLKKCHFRSIEISAAFASSSILTGLIKESNLCYLHSVVLITDEKGKEKIVDYTRNLIMLKEDYINLFEFKVLSKIDSKNIIDDFELLKEYGLGQIDTKTYLTFRDEILKDLNKNSHLLESENNLKKTI